MDWPKNTLIVYMADNGFSFGEQWTDRPSDNAYEESNEGAFV